MSNRATARHDGGYISDNQKTGHDRILSLAPEDTCTSSAPSSGVYPLAATVQIPIPSLPSIPSVMPSTFPSPLLPFAPPLSPYSRSLPCLMGARGYNPQKNCAICR